MNVVWKFRTVSMTAYSTSAQFLWRPFIVSR